MKKYLFILAGLIIFSYAVTGQVTLFYETFGTGAPGSIVQSDYGEYDNPGSFQVDTVEILIKKGGNSSSGYDEASGESFIQMDGHWQWDGISPLSDTLLIKSIDTRDHTDVYLSFGIFNRTGWSGISNHAFEAYYSSDYGEHWIPIDKTKTINGNHFPGNNQWGWVTIGDPLPAVEDLQILIENPGDNAHTCFIDDIMITGFIPDENPPSVPENLSAHNIDMNSVDLTWDVSTDNIEISHYTVLKDGKFFLTTAENQIQIRHQLPGSTADFSILAYDIANNASMESDRLNVQFLEKPADFEYSWKRSHARILADGSMEWMPESFQLIEGNSVRYIDFESGDDNNDGLSETTAWKHHPWDKNATGNAAACKGSHTYIFKRGVIYRGRLVVSESGSIIEPIRLTSDPSWGTGEARIFGSTRYTDGWTKADAQSAPDIPDPEKVWYRNISIPGTKYICELAEGAYVPLRLARSPNYQFTPDDPVESWWKWTDKKIIDDGDKIWLTDDNNLIQEDPEYYEGASVYSQEDAWVMCTVRFLDVLEWDPENNRVKMDHSKFGGKGCHYFIENTPFLLDTTGEFYLDEEAGRLFVRLENDKNPNHSVIEVAHREQLIEIHSKHHIEISGLTFGLTTSDKIRHWEADAKTAIRMTGVCSNIRISNNKFVYQNGGLSLHNLGSTDDNSHGITVCDNEFMDIGDLSLIFSTGGAYLDDINILRNKLTNVGFRQLGRQWSSIPAIYGQLNYGEVAGNVIDFSWGNGIDIFWGKGKKSGRYVPFVRGLIHHNCARNTVFGTNDYGGIESWQGGPTYCYNNRSHNAPGYRHYDNTSIGYAFYFDGCFKHYVFNNIASGESHQRNASSYMQVLGYYNMFVHNTGYNTRSMFDGAPGGLNGHNAYLSNIAEDIEVYFWHKIAPGYIPFDKYGYNLASEAPFKASLEDKSTYLDLASFRDKLDYYSSQLTHTAWNAGKTVLSDAENFDFRPRAAGEAIDRGVRFFAAFPLSRVVGEWNFYYHPADSSIIMADNLYLTKDFSNREIYQDIPKNHLHAHHVTADHFVSGKLEDWTNGALRFDGTSVYCSLSHKEIAGVKSNNVDMTTNDFIIETYLKTVPGHTHGTVVSKLDRDAGYVLHLDGSGKVKITLYENGTPAVSRSSVVPINDGQWHHVLIEVNRHSGICVYLDGEISNGNVQGTMPGAMVSISNTSDFLVGYDGDENYLDGTIDFLRISKGTLYDAKTNIDELYTWQTDGPFLYDMRGNKPIGKRDAGALEEGEKACEMSITPESLSFEYTETTGELTVDAASGFELLATESEMFTTEIDEEVISVSVYENDMAYQRKEVLPVFGCHETKYVPLIQESGPCYFTIEYDTIRIDKESQKIVIPLSTNGRLQTSCPYDFAYEMVNQTNDTMFVRVFNNSADSARIATVEIETCDGVHTLTIIQEGKSSTLHHSVHPDIEVFPNPVSERIIHIKVPESTGDYTCALMEMTGRVMRLEEFYTHEVSLPINVSPGMYILVLQGKDIVYKTPIAVN